MPITSPGRGRHAHSVAHGLYQLAGLPSRGRKGAPSGITPGVTRAAPYPRWPSRAGRGSGRRAKGTEPAHDWHSRRVPVGRHRAAWSRPGQRRGGRSLDTAADDAQHEPRPPLDCDERLSFEPHESAPHGHLVAPDARPQALSRHSTGWGRVRSRSSTS
jgi:hypothetical protein